MDKFPQLSPRQTEALEWICRYWQANQSAPTVREICIAMELQSTSANVYLVPLAKKGYLTRSREGGRMARNLRITELGNEWFKWYKKQPQPQGELAL